MVRRRLLRLSAARATSVVNPATSGVAAPNGQPTGARLQEAAAEVQVLVGAAEGVVAPVGAAEAIVALVGADEAAVAAVVGGRDGAS
jgi:hypothetical protein